MHPAGEARQPRTFRRQGSVGGKGVALQPTGEAFQHLQGHGVRTPRVEVEKHSFLRPDNDPKITRLRFPRMVGIVIRRDRLIITKPHVNPPFSHISILSPSRCTSRAPSRPTDLAAPWRLTPKNDPSGAPQAHECPAPSQSSRFPPTWPGLSGEAHAFSSPRFNADAPSAPKAHRSGRSSGPVGRRGLPNPPPAFAAPRSCASGRSW